MPTDSTVTQAAREAAAEFLPGMNDYWRKEMLAGRMDNNPTVQRLARFEQQIRLASSATPAGEVAALQAEVRRLREALVAERENNLWSAYNTGHTKDGRWTHMFMSDGEWLARECGFDPKLPDYPDDDIRAAIPAAARHALTESLDDVRDGNSEGEGR